MHVSALRLRADIIFKKEGVFEVIHEDLAIVMAGRWRVLDKIKDQDKKIMERVALESQLQATDQKTYAVVANVIGVEYLHLLDSTKSAYVNWQMVLRFFTAESSVQIMNLHGMFNSFAFRSGVSLMKQISALLLLVQDLKAAGQPKSPEEVITKLLAALSSLSRWKFLVDGWRGFNILTDLSTENFVSRVRNLIDASPEMDNIESTDVGVFLAQAAVLSSSAACHYCKKSGHFVRECPVVPPCRKCNRKGHKTEACRQTKVNETNKKCIGVALTESASGGLCDQGSVPRSLVFEGGQCLSFDPLIGEDIMSQSAPSSSVVISSSAMLAVNAGSSLFPVVVGLVSTSGDSDGIGSSGSVRLVVDSGCTRTIVKDSSMLSDSRAGSVVIETADSRSSVTSVVGNLSLPVHGGVISVPAIQAESFRQNLLSVRQVASALGGWCVFGSDRWAAFDSTGRMALSGGVQNGLYVLDVDRSLLPLVPVSTLDAGSVVDAVLLAMSFWSLDPGGRVLVTPDAVLLEGVDESIRVFLASDSLVMPSQFAMSATVDAFTLWHARFGHVGLKALRALAAAGKIPSVPMQSGVCAVCARTKLTRRPAAVYKPVRHVAVRPGERIHCDIAGPIEPVSRHGRHYFILFVDEFSRFIFGYTMRFNFDGVAVPC